MAVLFVALALNFKFKTRANKWPQNRVDLKNKKINKTETEKENKKQKIDNKLYVNKTLQHLKLNLCLLIFIFIFCIIKKFLKIKSRKTIRIVFNRYETK